MECTHPIQVAGLCAICGKEIDEGSFDQPTFATLHSSASVKVSRDEAIRMDSEETQRLIEQRKLALIVDLDQTIIHVTVDPTVKEWAHDINNPNWPALKDIVAFQLGADGKTVSHQPEHIDEEHVKNFATDGDENGCWYYVKLRPGLTSFLATLAEKYELHVYTMGTRSYADCICRIVDPEGHLFGARILSRDENGSDVQKSLSRLFPISTDMVVIIDDRADVWSWSPNLIKVEPYEFFVGIGDINASHLGPTKPLVPLTGVPTHPTTVPSITDEQQQKSIQEQRDARPLKRIQEEKLEQQAKEKEEMEKEEKQLDVELLHDDLVLKNDDTELELIESILLELHAQWYEGFDTEKTKYAQAEFVTSRPDVKNVLRRMKKEVLKGCGLVFSGLIPLGQEPETAAIWTMAEDFGAKCYQNLEKDVTHVVTANPHTLKAEEAYRRGNIHVVWPSWLNDSICRWMKQGEATYIIPRNTKLSLLPVEVQNISESTYSEADPDASAAMANLANMDWGEAEDEVDAFLDEEEEDAESEYDSQASSILGSDVDQAQSEVDKELLLTPLSKRRRLAALRGGPSKLRQSFLAEDATNEPDEGAEASSSPESSPKRRRVEPKETNRPAKPKEVETLQEASTQPASTESEDEHFLDDLALEMERELGEGGSSPK